MICFTKHKTATKRTGWLLKKKARYIKRDKQNMAAVSTMSKKRYNDIVASLHKHLHQHNIDDDHKIELILADLRSIMKFDPDATRYTPELAQKEKERRHKLRDEHGISTYVTSGTKLYRERRKQQTI